MNHHFFALGQPEAWRNKPAEKVKLLIQTLKSIPKPPINPRCINLFEQLSIYIEDPANKDQTQKMKQCVKELNRIEDIPKTKSRLCGGLLTRGDKAYKCFDCMTEDNSILCQKCFELDKHDGHDFERCQVFGGCCDCGDIEKWKKEGFCSEHNKDQQIEIILDQTLVNLFLQEQLYSLKILMKWYASLVNFKNLIKSESWKEVPQYGDIQTKLKNETIKQGRIIVDNFGGPWMEQLVEFNKAGKFANKMTSMFFNVELQETFLELLKCEGKYENNPVLLCLFSMTELKVMPEKVADLCITMFPLEGFRETITVLYVNLYNNNPSFTPSDYTHLSSQLLTSYITVSKIVKDGRMNALRYEPTCNGYEEIQPVSQGYLRYYYDIKYLSKLYGDASIDYFKLHGEQKKFTSLGYYRIIFDQFDNAIDYYGLDEIFLERIMPLIKVIERDTSQCISNMALKELYKFISTHKTSYHNKFRPQERLFAWILFVRLKGDLSLLESDDIMKELFMILGVQNFQEEIENIMRNLCSLFETASKMIENVNEIESKYTFFSFYMKKSQQLFNLDALLLKISLKFCQFYKKLNSFFEYQYLLVKNVENPSQMFYQSQQMSDPDYASKLVRHLNNYVAIIIQAIFSDLPILTLSALHNKETEQIKKFKSIIFNHEEAALYYYQCLLRSEDTKKIPIKLFKSHSEIFFKEEFHFKKFVENNRDPENPLKIMKNNESGPQINSMYFKSLAAIPHEAYKSGYYLPPYFNYKNNNIINVFLDPLLQSIKLINFMINDLESEEIDFKNKFIPYSIIEIWKISLFSPSPQTTQVLKDLFNNKSLENQIKSINKQLLSEMSTKAHHIDSNAELRRKEENKKKLEEKKALMKQRIKGNAEKILESQSVITSEASEMKCLNDLVCCFCKQSTEEELYLQGFVTFTNGNGWLSTARQNFIPIFDSCGHAVHRSCHFKLIKNKNRVYNFCPLCKQITNILLPEQESLSEECILFFLNTLIQIYENLQIKTDMSDLINRISQSLIFQLILKGCTMYEEFLKNLKTYQILYKLYISLDQKNQQEKYISLESIKKGELLLDSSAPPLFVDVNLFMEHILNQKKYSSPHLTQNFVDNAYSLLALLQGKQPMMHENSLPELEFIQSSIVFPKIESNLASMNSKYRGKCHQCGLITNNQMICMSCPNFITCANCTQAKMTDHSNQYHAGVTIYIKTSSGESLYIMHNRCWKFESLYQDYMGRPFDNPVKKVRQDFSLNEYRLESLKKDVITMKVEKKIRYKENQTGRVFNSDIH